MAPSLTRNLLFTVTAAIYKKQKLLFVGKATCKETCEVELTAINQHTRYYLRRVNLNLNGYDHYKDLCSYNQNAYGKLFLIRCISWETGNHELLNVYYNDFFIKIIYISIIFSFFFNRTFFQLLLIRQHAMFVLDIQLCMLL